MEYLTHEEIKSSLSNNNKYARVYTNSTKKFIWKILSSLDIGTSIRRCFEIHNKQGNSVKPKHCEYTDEYDIVMSKDYADNSPWWEFETDDIFSDRFRIKECFSGKYFGVGDSSHVVLSSDYDDSRKIEWIFESLPNQVDDVENETVKMCPTVEYWKL